MQFKLSLLALSSLSILATANPVPQGGQCNTGSTLCCNTVQSATSNPIASLLGLLGLNLGSVTGLVGLGCTPLSIIGVGSGVNCAQQPVCCTGNQFNGLINVGCSPISL